jgi:putative endonuclease
MSDWFTYVLRCADDTLYCGVTTDIDRRVSQHNSGKGAKYMQARKRRPAKLELLIPYPTKRDAYSAEYYVKRMTRLEKIKLIGMDPAAAALMINNKKTKK